MFSMSPSAGGLSWLEREMDELFRNVLPVSAVPQATRESFPALNIWEDAQSYHVEAELPGLGIEDLELSVVDQQLSIRGERRDPEAPELAWHRRERPVGKFARLVELPAPVDSEKVTAGFANGVLRVTLPKLEAAKPRKIEVKRIESKN